MKKKFTYSQLGDLELGTGEGVEISELTKRQRKLLDQFVKAGLMQIETRYVITDEGEDAFDAWYEEFKRRNP